MTQKNIKEQSKSEKVAENIVSLMSYGAIGAAIVATSLLAFGRAYCHVNSFSANDFPAAPTIKRVMDFLSFGYRTECSALDPMLYFGKSNQIISNENLGRIVLASVAFLSPLGNLITKPVEKTVELASNIDSRVVLYGAITTNQIAKAFSGKGNDNTVII